MLRILRWVTAVMVVLGGAAPAAAADDGRGAAPVSVRVGLAGRDPAGLEAFAKAVSTPGDARYRHFLSPQEARERFGPTREQAETVRRWLSRAGMRVTAQGAHWIDATGSPAAVRHAFGGGERRVPADLVGVVSGVAQLGMMSHGVREGATGAIAARRAMGLADPRESSQARGGRPTADAMSTDARGGARSSAESDCSPTWGAVTTHGFPPGYNDPEPLDVCGYTPAQLRAAYGVTASGLTGKGVTVAVIDAYGSPTMLADANRFSREHGDQPFAPGQYRETVTPNDWRHLNDQVCQSPPDWAGEEALDVEMVHGMAPGATVHYYGANSCADEDINNTLADIVDTHGADIVSSSFGETMHRLSGDVDPALVTQTSQLFQQAATEGIGFYVSSGDCGDDGADLVGPNCDPLSARAQTEWPASSPWVTSVGGTALAVDEHGGYRWETSMGDRRSVLAPDGHSWVPFPGAFYFGGGGGTSEDFKQPYYQAGVVPDRLARTLDDGSPAAAAMRTVPDVAMNGDLLTAVLVGVTDANTGRYGEGPVGGTSVSAPLFAAVQAAAQEGLHKPIGFAGPMLYQRAGKGEFTDVVDHPAAAPSVISAVIDLGTDPNGHRKVRLYELGQDNGLHAEPGYDLATGLGSPRAEYLDSFKQ